MTTVEEEPTTADAPPTTSASDDDDRVRVDAPLKVTGTATYAYEQPVENPAYLFPIVSTIARGQITSIDASAAEEVPGVVLVVTHENAPRLRVKTSPDLWILQSNKINHRGEFIGAVVADSPLAARHAASQAAARNPTNSIAPNP